jgi:hypothetical protein
MEVFLFDPTEWTNDEQTKWNKSKSYRQRSVYSEKEEEKVKNKFKRNQKQRGKQTFFQNTTLSNMFIPSLCHYGNQEVGKPPLKKTLTTKNMWSITQMLWQQFRNGW